MDALISVESGGTPGILGPRTRYGQAQGLTQMLPGTAQEMARKLGVPWRPDLMTGTTPEAADYQRRLGAAYLNQGYQATGNLADALRYYHGGPNRKMWGPKTNSYATKVMSRVRGQ
jgi:soluble lytic murein transglycosylase-like protein